MMAQVFYRKRFSSYLGEQRAIDDIITQFVPDGPPPSPSPTPTPSSTPTTPTPTLTPSITPTLTPTNTTTPTPTVTPTSTETPTPTATPTITPTNTTTPTHTVTSTPTNTSTPTVTPTNTSTPTVTPSSTPSTFSPQSISGITAWWDNISGITLSSGFVSNWVDRVSSITATTIPNSTNMTFTATQNGYSGVTSPGGKAMTLSSNISTTDFTIFGVFQNTTSTDPSGYILGDTTQQGLGSHVLAAYGGPGIFIYQDPLVCAGGINTNNVQYSTYIKDSSTSKVRQDGNQVGTAGGNSNPFVISRLFDGNGNLSFSMDGTIWEFIIYNRVLTAGEITQVETYIQNKYGL